MGTKSVAIDALDGKVERKVERVVTNAMQEKNRLEEEGFGDQLAEIQQTSWPLDRIVSGKEFLVDMCFHCRDSTLQWYRGRIDSVVNDKSSKNNTIEVMILWNEEHMDEGQMNPTKQILRKTLWNNSIHVNGTWREDLRHRLPE